MSNVLAITYDVWISGTKLGTKKKSCINSIEIKETVSGSDVATLQITDPEFLYIEDDIFIEDNTIQIKMGWSNTTYREEFDGYISAIDINFDSDGCPKLTVTCMDKTHVMNRAKKNETFKNCTSADVVKKKCAEYGFTCVIDSSYSYTVQETITQSDQTDIDFITKLANDEVYPFTARLVGNTFYYVKVGKLETPKMTLTYKKYPHDIISFSPKINKETKQVEIKSASLNTSDKSINKTDGKVPTGNGSASSGDTSYKYNYDTWDWDRQSTGGSSGYVNPTVGDERW